MILFVGDKPSNKMKPGAKPFEGAACEPRLKHWIIQLCTDYRIVNQSQDHFESIKILAAHFNIPIIALGNNASRALKGIKHFKLPHPSGKNRQINNTDFINDRLDACKRWLEAHEETVR